MVQEITGLIHSQTVWYLTIGPTSEATGHFIRKPVQCKCAVNVSQIFTILWTIAGVTAKPYLTFMLPRVWFGVRKSYPNCTQGMDWL